jgi:hypothetical protein
VTVDEVLALLDDVKQTGGRWRSLCPAHPCESRSLSITEGDDGRVLLKCFAGCTVDKITAALGLQITDLFSKKREPLPTWRPPKTREERLEAENRRLRRQVRALALDQRRYSLALGRAALIIATTFHDDQAGVLDRLWQGAVDQLEAEAAAAADAA